MQNKRILVFITSLIKNYITFKLFVQVVKYNYFLISLEYILLDIMVSFRQDMLQLS